MVATIINLVIVAVGIYFTYTGWKAGQHSEAYDSILPFVGGICLLLIALIFAVVRWIWFQ